MSLDELVVSGLVAVKFCMSLVAVILLVCVFGCLVVEPAVL